MKAVSDDTIWIFHVFSSGSSSGGTSDASRLFMISMTGISTGSPEAIYGICWRVTCWKIMWTLWKRMKGGPEKL